MYVLSSLFLSLFRYVVRYYFRYFIRSFVPPSCSYVFLYFDSSFLRYVFRYFVMYSGISLFLSVVIILGVACFISLFRYLFN